MDLLHSEYIDANPNFQFEYKQFDKFRFKEKSKTDNDSNSCIWRYNNFNICFSELHN
jgi:hypothetical protein